MLAMYFLSLNKIFDSTDKIHDLFSRTDPSTGMTILKFTVVCIAVLSSIKLPQDMEKVLMVSGGLFGTVILVLFPILIYNKT